MKKPEITRPKGVSPAFAAVYTNRGTFVLSLGGFDSGYLYECSYDLEDPIVRIMLCLKFMSHSLLQALQMHGESESQVRFVSIVKEGSYFILGADDGSIRVHNGTDFQRSYSLPVHDNTYGRVVQVAASFDNSYLLSIGADGNFFVFAAAYTGDLEPVRFLMIITYSTVLYYIWFLGAIWET